MRGRGVDATLAAIATLTAAWPISTLLVEPTWLGGTVLLLAAIAISGVAARSLSLRGWQVLVAQLAFGTLAASWIYGRGHLWHGLPYSETLRFAVRRSQEALHAVQTYAAPAPSTPGLIFAVGCALGLVAIAVDYLAVTRRSPSLAGLPLLSAFLASAANSGSSLPVIFFAVAAAMWLILVGRQGSAILRRWATTMAVARTPVMERRDSQGVYGYASIARALGLAALFAAVAVPVGLPHLHPKFFASGLGRSPLATGNVSSGVGFSLSIYLAEDLTDQGSAPVLQYTTTDPSPPPLRVAVSSFYRSAPGVWLPWGGALPELSANPEVPGPVGLLPNVPRTRFTMTVAHNLLDDPNLAVPFPLVSADLKGIDWGADVQTQNVRVAQRPDSYTSTYWRLNPTVAELENTPSLSDRERRAFDVDLLLDGPSADPVTALSERLTKGKSSDYDKAMAIQQYLLATGGFTYSLTLAPPARDRSGNVAGFDPLTNFLVTKKGYCVQFASAMVMMSRAAGIPAHMAIGFTPGTLVKGVWTVIASDAHAWPELYLDGLGWTRFEPTPSRAAPPVYAIPASPAGAAGSGTKAKGTKTTTPGGTAPKNLVDPSTGKSGATRAATSLSSRLRWLTSGWGLVLLAYILGLLGSLVVPTAAQWRRRRKLVAAQSAAQRVEVHWAQLTSSLSDLGIARAPSRTPRQLRVYYDQEAYLEGAASEALGRVVGTLESSRYAAPGPVPDGFASDARLVFRAAAAGRRPRDRVRAALWSSEGRAQLRAMRTSLASHLGAPMRYLNDAFARVFPHRR